MITIEEYLLERLENAEELIRIIQGNVLVYEPTTAATRHAFDIGRYQGAKDTARQALAMLKNDPSIANNAVKSEQLRREAQRTLDTEN